MVFPIMIQEIKNKCSCGCGKEIIAKKYHSWYGSPMYIKGHNIITNPIHQLRRINHKYKDRIKIKCLSCDEEREVLPCYSKRKFCSVECFWEYQRINKRGRKSTSLDLEQIKNMYKNENKSCLAIAKIMKTSQQTISRRINFLNMQKRPQGVYERDEQSKRNLSLRFKGKTYEEMHGIKKSKRT